jgi:hypothetical protein
MPRHDGHDAHHRSGHAHHQHGHRHHHHHHHHVRHIRRPSPPWIVFVRSAPVFVPTLIEVPSAPVIVTEYPPVPGPIVVPPWARAPAPVQVTLYARALDMRGLALDLDAAAGTEPAQVVEFLRQTAALPEVVAVRACRFEPDGVAATNSGFRLYTQWTATPVFATPPGANDPTYWVVLTDTDDTASCIAYARTPQGEAARAEAREDVRHVLTALARLGAKPDLADAPERLTVYLPPGAPIDPTLIR